MIPLPPPAYPARQMPFPANPVQPNLPPTLPAPAPGAPGR